MKSIEVREKKKEEKVEGSNDKLKTHRHNQSRRKEGRKEGGEISSILTIHYASRLSIVFFPSYVW